MVEVIGIDHIYITVSDLAKAERFYDIVLAEVLEFRKNDLNPVLVPSGLRVCG